LFSKGRPKNHLDQQHYDRVGDIYHNWTATEGLSVIVNKEDAIRNDYNLSPSRYVSTGAETEVLPLDEAVVLLREAEEERTETDQQLKKVLTDLGF